MLLALIAERERPTPSAEEIALANEEQEIEEMEEVVTVVRMEVLDWEGAHTIAYIYHESGC